MLDRVGSGAEISGDRMTGFVESGKTVIVLCSDLALFLRTHDYLHIGVLDLVHTDQVFALSCGKEGGLVEKVCKIGSGEADGRLCYLVEIDGVFKGLALGVNMEDVLSALEIRIVYRDLTVKASGAEKCGVKDIGL